MEGDRAMSKRKRVANHAVDVETCESVIDEGFIKLFSDKMTYDPRSFYVPESDQRIRTP